MIHTWVKNNGSKGAWGVNPREGPHYHFRFTGNSLS